MLDSQTMLAAVILSKPPWGVVMNSHFIYIYFFFKKKLMTRVEIINIALALSAHEWLGQIQTQD